MNVLEQRILDEGIARPGDVLEVDSFLNQQVDPQLSIAMGNAFAERFRDTKIDRILTVESSGIAIGLTTALALNQPLVFARKKKSILMVEEVYSAPVFSYTKQETNQIFVLKKFLPAGEQVLLIDDFLANGSAAFGLISLVEAAGSQVAGIGIAIEKSFMPGREKLNARGYHVESLARIHSLEGNSISFVQE